MKKGPGKKSLVTIQSGTTISKMSRLKEKHSSSVAE